MVDRVIATCVPNSDPDVCSSGGCCDGSVPNCYKVGEVLPGQR